MNARSCLLLAATLAATSSLVAQSGRTMSLSSAPVIGASTSIITNYPVAAAGNVWTLGWSNPFPLAVPLTVPGLTVVGLARIDATNFVSTDFGVYDPSGTVSSTLAIPNRPLFIGYALDVQTIDLDGTTSTLYLADNDVQFAIGCGIGEVNIAEATTTSLTAGNNDLKFLNNGNVGAPTSQGIARFSYLPIRHRGDEGYVEGFAGTFSSTSHNSDIDSISNFRTSRRTANGAYQVLACPNGYDVSIIRDLANPNQFGVLSYERATGTARVIPGSTWIDTVVPGPAAQQTFYMGISLDGNWGALIIRDSAVAPAPVLADRVIAFRTNGLSAAIDITSTAPVAAQYFDGSLLFTNDFLLVAGSAGWMYTSATAPTTLVPLPLPNTAASNLPNVWVFTLSSRLTRDGSAVYLPISSIAASSRQEMDIVKITNNGGVPLATNYTQFSAQTGIGEFGYNGYSPSNLTNSAVGLKASVSPNGNKIAFCAATPTNTVWPGFYVADGTPNPTLHTVAGANIYAEVTFINDTTVMFFAGTAVSGTDQSTALYKLDVPTGTITQVSAATDIRTRGNFFSRNKNWWYFIRSTTASLLNNIVAVNCATGAVHDVTGNEFGGGGTVGTIRTGSFNTTADPWFALEMQLRRAPTGPYAYFTARKETGTSGVFEDANVFRFDMENGGTAVQLTNNTATGALTAIKQIESLMISQDGNHIAWGQRVNTVATSSEDVFHMDLTTNVITQASVTLATGQTITDGSIRFTCDNGGTPSGIVWSRGTGSVTVPTANAVVEWAPLGSSTPVRISAPAAGTRLYQVIGTNL